MYQLLKELCEAPAVAGREQAVIDIMTREFQALCDRVSVDDMGNVTGLRKSSSPGAKRVMVSAHMDEVGSVVSHIDDKGLVYLSPRGWQPSRTFTSQRVRICGRRDIIGTIETYPFHLLPESEKALAPKTDQLFIDTGLSPEDVRENVEIGDIVVFDSQLIENGDALIAKAFDDRIGCYILVEALKRVKKLEVDLYTVATTQEEVGFRGAMRVAREINPDIGLSLDVTFAFDLPGVPGHMQVSRMGHGVAIKIADAGSIANHGLVEFLKKTAKANDIKYQLDILPYGATEAKAMQMFGGGAVCSLAVPTRYVHSPSEMIHKGDLEGMIDLLVKFLETCQDCKLGW